MESYSMHSGVSFVSLNVMSVWSVTQFFILFNFVCVCVFFDVYNNTVQD